MPAFKGAKHSASLMSDLEATKDDQSWEFYTAYFSGKPKLVFSCSDHDSAYDYSIDTVEELMDRFGLLLSGAGIEYRVEREFINGSGLWDDWIFHRIGKSI